MIRKKMIGSLLLIAVSSGLLVKGQIGIGTANPRGALDINKGDINDMGLVLPTNSSETNINGVQGNPAVIGTVFYDSTKDCIRLKQQTGWSDCTGSAVVGRIGTLVCSNPNIGGTFFENIYSVGTVAFTYAGGTAGSYPTVSFHSTGITGLAATLMSGNITGATGNMVLAVSGIASGIGNANFTINILGKSCNFSIRVDPKPAGL